MSGGIPVDDAPTWSLIAGRAVELQVLGQSLATASAGTPVVVVVEAQAGMGKTALLRAFLHQVSAPWVVRHLVCDRFEQDVPYGLVGILLGSMPPAEASSVMVGQAVLDWLSEDERGAHGVVLVIDDVQSMDRPSVDALRFALRRVRVDRVVAVLARRPSTGGDLWSGLLGLTGLTTVLPLGPLSAGDVAQLALHEGSRLDGDEAEQVVRQTGACRCWSRRCSPNDDVQEPLQPGRRGPPRPPWRRDGC